MFECVCIDADELPTVFHEKTVKARKPHTCIECGDTIPVGARYRRETGLWDGDWRQYDTCFRCAAIRDDFMSCGWEYGSMWNTLIDAWGPDAKFLGAPGFEEEPEDCPECHGTGRNASQAPGPCGECCRCGGTGYAALVGKGE